MQIDSSATNPSLLNLKSNPYYLTAGPTCLDFAFGVLSTIRAFGWKETGVGPLDCVSPSSKALRAGSIWFTGALADSCKSVWVRIRQQFLLHNTHLLQRVAQLTLLAVQTSQLYGSGVKETGRVVINTNGHDNLDVEKDKASGGSAMCDS